jgi:hypothetical protein
MNEETNFALPKEIIYKTKSIEYSNSKHGNSLAYYVFSLSDD